MDVELGLLHVAGGASRQSPPPGTLAQEAPRRAARGRSHDLFFINLGLEDIRAAQLVSEAASAFFGTPGSVTAALRQAALTVNQTLLDSGVQANFTAGALRNRDLYLAQCGASQSMLVRSGSVGRMVPGEVNSRPLGSSQVPMVNFRHLELQPGDLLIASGIDGEGWPDSVLAELGDLNLDQSLDRLGTVSVRDVQGLLLRVPGPTTAGATQTAPKQPRRAARTATPAPSGTPPTGAASQPGAYDLPAAVAGRTRWLSEAWSKLQSSARRGWSALINVMLRLAPGLVESPRAGEFSPNVLAFTAAAVPILVVGLSTLIYFRSGRTEQFQAYLAQAQAAAISAQAEADPQLARPDWVLASQWLDLADGYQHTDESDALRQQVQAALDQLDLIVRLDFAPTISGGFGPQADIRLLAATPTDFYAYDQGTDSIWHAWSTGRGYEIDSQFECLSGKASVPEFGTPVDMLIEPEPGALGTEGVVALDAEGRLLYCAPGVPPLTGQLAPPDQGWGEIKAISVFGGKLYLLDPVKNAVWIYDATDGLFSGSPALYFVDDVPALGTAIDLALAQDELIILYGGGSIDRCRRITENTTSGTIRIRVECETEPSFQDERPGQPPRATIPDASPTELVYSPPPEPSLFFLDPSQGAIYHYSMRLVYQGKYPTPFESAISAITQGPPNNLFVAAADQVYVAQIGR